MGYCVSLVESNLKFKKEDANIILSTLKEFAKNALLRWCDEDEILESDTIEECFERLRYPLTEKENYYIINDFYGEKLGDEERIFNSIYKYIEKGSYLEYVGDDGDRFRLVFGDKKCEYKYPKLIWD